jgi:DNA adenine methylase
MRYLGGKSRIAVPIVKFLESMRKPNQKYVEPFVGAAWIISLMSGVREAYDKHPYLIAMWKALQDGWVPPKTLTKEQYYEIKEHGTDQEKGFVGFGCSFAGKWFGGFATEPKRDYCLNAHNSVMKKLKTLQDVKFEAADYRNLYMNDCLIYCDPPYQGTTGYGLIGDFDTCEFWEIMRKWSINNTVVISEYSAPDDFKCVWQQEVKTDMRNKHNQKEKRIEKLFRFGGFRPH